MPTKSIYLDENTAKLAEDLARSQGVGLSELLREVLAVASRVSGPIEQFALVQDCSSVASGIEKDPYRFDTWIDIDNTKKVLLMGTTMYRALSGYEQIWRSLLSSGAHMQVLLQGGIEKTTGETTDSLVSSLIVGESEEDTIKRKNDAISFLRELSKAVDPAFRGHLEARHTRRFIITHSTVLIWDKGPQSKVAVQIHPYAAGQSVHGKDLRFSFVTSEKSRIYAAIMRPIGELWSTATSILPIA